MLSPNCRRDAVASLLLRTLDKNSTFLTMLIFCLSFPFKTKDVGNEKKDEIMSAQTPSCKTFDTLTDALERNFPVLETIQSILSGSPIQDDTFGEGHHSLHATFSEFQPDSALICMALGTLRILDTIGENSPILEMECKRIIGEYGPLWLDNADMADTDPREVLERLMHVPDDLGSLSELLRFHADSLRGDHIRAAVFMDIFQVQAEAQIVIAEDFIDTLSAHDSVFSHAAANTETAVPVAALSQTMTDNVIRFPVELRG